MSENNWTLVRHPAQDKTVPQNSIPLGYENGKTHYFGKHSVYLFPGKIEWCEAKKRWRFSNGLTLSSEDEATFVCAPKQLVHVIKNTGVIPADVINHLWEIAVVSKVKVKDQDNYIIVYANVNEKKGDIYWVGSTTEFYYVCVWPNDHSGEQVDIGHGNRLVDLGASEMTNISNLNDESNQAVWRNAVFCIAEAQYDCFPAIDSPFSIGRAFGSRTDEECILQYTGDLFIKGTPFANLQIKNGRRTVAWALVQIGYTFKQDREEAFEGEHIRRALTDSLSRGQKMILYHHKSLPADYFQSTTAQSSSVQKDSHSGQMPQQTSTSTAQSYRWKGSMESTARARRYLTDSLAGGFHMMSYYLKSVPTIFGTAEPSDPQATALHFHYYTSLPPAQLTTSQPQPAASAVQFTQSQAGHNMEVILNQENCERELSKVLELNTDRLEDALQQKTMLNPDGDEVKVTWGKLNVNVDTQCKIASYDTQIVYENFTKPKGLAVVFNNKHFSNMEERTGTDYDAGKICMLLTQIGYEVTLKRDKSARDMLAAMRQFAQKAEHNDCHSAVVVVLSHGGYGKIYGTDCMDETDGISVKQFIGCLNVKHCAGLRGKPKLFFIQACRGHFRDEGQHTNATDRQGSAASSIGAVAEINERSLTDASTFLAPDDVDFTDSGFKLPLNSDIFMAFSTTSGYVSWRNNRGSWFIQAIVQVFEKKCAKEDLQSMMTEVVQIVTDAFETSSGEKQCPEIRSHLRKKFYFFPGLTSPPNL